MNARQIRFEWMRTIPGPNVHSHQPVIDSVIDLGPYGDRETREWDGLNDRLTTLLPGLARHHCAAGQAGGLLERLQGGTFFGHVIEHVALELSDLAGIGRNFGRTRMVSAPSRYRIVVAYASEAGMKFLLEAAAELVEAVAEGTEFDLDKVISDARAIVSANEPGPSTGAILDAARERNVPTTPILAPSVWQLGYGSRRALIAAALTSRTSAVSVDLASAKHDTRCILGTAGLPVPEGEVVESLADANAAMKRLGAPVVVKPVDGNQGKGVTLDVSTKQEMRRGFNAARDFGPKVIVERLITGSDYRFFLVDGALVAASHRTPAHVVGDGEHTIEQLIEITNSDPRRGQGHDAPLTRLRLGGQTVSCLARAGYTPSSVPPAGTTVMLSQTANLSTGGSATDVTDAVHVEVRAMVERAARVIGLDVCGMDVVARRIDVPLAESGATIIEVNAAPGIRMHEHPSMGTPRAAGEAVLESLFPHDSPARIPVVAVTGTNGKTTTVRMVAHVMSGCGCRVGYTTTSGITIAGREVVTGDCTGPVSARTVLTDPGVDIAVLETARGGIVRSGLGWDYCDVAVVTNVTADHIGQDGIRSVEDIVHIKALVPERVRVGGTVVLNANDPASLGMRDRPLVQAQQPEFVLFSLEPENPAMLEHVRAGGLGYAMVDDWICEQRGTETTRLLHICDVPATLGGALLYNVENALAAIAVLRAVDSACPLEALRTFEPANNPGRGQLYEVGEAHAFLDYGHNPAAIRSVGAAATAMQPDRTRCVLGVPGDRDETVIRECARAASAFDIVYIREDIDKRGRAPGEVASILHDELTRAGTKALITGNEKESVDVALAELDRNELLVVFLDEDPTAPETLAAIGARPVGSILRTQATPTRT